MAWESPGEDFEFAATQDLNRSIVVAPRMRLSSKQKIVNMEQTPKKEKGTHILSVSTYDFIFIVIIIIATEDALLFPLKFPHVNLNSSL